VQERALVSRKIVPLLDGRARIAEVWDLLHPDCPYAVAPCYRNRRNALPHPHVERWYVAPATFAAGLKEKP
jgi:hypothetical protein